MDERSTDEVPEESLGGRRRGRRVVTALMVAGVLAAVPAGVALAGGSDGSASGAGNSTGAGSLPVQSTAPDDGQRDRGQGDRGDCPEKDGQGAQEESTQL
jgi:hypothetical protein